MSIEEIEAIDAIGEDKELGAIVLTISDHLDWSKVNHLELLQEKLNTYLTFIESGELLETYPRARGKKVSIVLVYKHLPNKEGYNFLNQVSNIIENTGLQFSFKELKKT